MMEKNGVYGGTVVSLGTGGEGIIYSEGTTAFVPFCVTGERVKFKALKVKNGIAYGKLEEVEHPSLSRVEPPCPLFGRCGGCDLQHIDYAAQLGFKKDLVENALKKIGGISAEVSPTVPCDRQFRYRNKLVLPIGRAADGKTVVGFYARRSHRIVPARDCLIQPEWAKDIIAAIQSYSAKSGYSGYCEEDSSGELRRIAVRESGKKFIIVLVAARQVKTDILTDELQQRLGGDFTFLLNINNSPSNAVFSGGFKVLRGEGFISAEDRGIKYKAGPETFLQVNDGMRNQLYGRVLGEAASENGVAINLYSGGGMLTAMLAGACKKAYGVEVVEEASRCADELCLLNGLQGKMINVCGRAEDKLGDILNQTKGQNRIVVCDPPRKGLERRVALTLKDCAAEKIIMVSCNPATLARDLGIITGSLRCDGEKLVPAQGGDYRIVSVTPFDMFPQTAHVETLVCLERKA